MSDDNEVLTLREVSKYLKISTDALADLVRRHRIPAFKVGRQWRFRKSSIDRWAEKQEQRAILA